MISDVIWLNDLLDEIKMSPEMREVMCKAPTHTGPNPILTDEFVPKPSILLQGLSGENVEPTWRL